MYPCLFQNLQFTRDNAINAAVMVRGQEEYVRVCACCSTRFYSNCKLASSSSLPAPAFKSTYAHRHQDEDPFDSQEASTLLQIGGAGESFYVGINRP
jgi:hypothetical protein